MSEFMNHPDQDGNNGDPLDDPRVDKLVRGEAAIKQESFSAAEKWIDDQPIDILRQIVDDGKWVIGPNVGGPYGDMPEKELREYMKDQLCEDSWMAAEAFVKNNIPFEIEVYEDDEEE